MDISDPPQTFNAVYLSILVATCVLTLLANFIIRRIHQVLEGGDVASVTSIRHNPPEVDLRRANFPCWINAATSSSASDSCRVDLGCCDCCRLLVRGYWGVKVAAFHHILQSPWSWFSRAFLSPDGNLFGADNCVAPGPIHEQLPGGSGRMDLVLKMATGGEGRGLELGPAPRQSYPLVLAAMPRCQGEEQRRHLAGAMLAVLHVQDEVCPVATHPIATFIKSTESASSLQLVPMYVDEECVACREAPASRCLLPCKHACVCRKCFARLKNRCPMCRTFIQSYFPIRSEDREQRNLSDDPTAVTSANSGRTFCWRLLRSFVTGAGWRDDA